MEKQRRVALYGDSLLLASVGASLAKYAQLETILLDASRPLDEGALAVLEPDALLLDLRVVNLESAFALARGRPELLLIGLDPAGERLLVLSGQQARALTTEALVGLILNGGRLGAGANGRRQSSPKAPPARATA